MIKTPSGSSKLVNTSAVLVGACQLVPLPFIDDVIETRILRGMLRRIFAKHGHKLTREQIKTLSHDRKGVLATTAGLARGVVMKPIRKLFRYVFFAFTARGISRKIAATVLLGRAAETVASSPNFTERSDLGRIRDAYLKALEELDLGFADNFSVLINRQRKNPVIPTDPETDLGGETPQVRINREELNREVADVTQILEKPSVKDHLHAFDALFRRNLPSLG